MASIQIPNLTAATTVSGAEQMEAVQGGSSVRVTIQQIADLAGFQYGLQPIPDNTILGNISGVSALPYDNTLSQYLDYAFSNTQGAVLFRGPSSWQALAPGLLDQVLSTQGTGADPIWRSTPGTGTVTSITAGTNLSATPSNPITSAGTINTVMNPAFTTSVTTPSIYGGSSASQTLLIQSTTGVGTSDSIVFKVGNNGAITAMTIASDGTVTIPQAAIDTTSITVPLLIGGTTASSSLTLKSTSGVGTSDSILFKVGNNGATTALTIGTTGASIFGVSATSPIIYGGATASSSLTLQSTSGVGTTDSILMKVGNNGATTAVSISSAGVTTISDVSITTGSVTLTSAVISANSSTNAVRITQTGTGNALLVEDSANPDSTPFVINSGGTVLIGATTSESFYLPGFNTNYGAGIQGTGTAYNAGGSWMALSQWSTSTTTSGGSFISLNKSNGTPGTHTIVTSGQRVGAIGFAGSDGANFVGLADIYGEVDGTPGTNDMPGRLIFATTADGASLPTERMRIRSDGGVAIGGIGASTVSLYVQKNITGGSTSYGFLVNGTIQSDVTTSARYIQSASNLAAGATITNINHFFTSEGTLSGTVTNQISFNAGGDVVGATNNFGFYASNSAAVTTGKTAYGFYSLVNTATGGGTTWGFYGAGTANNAFLGNVAIGSVTAPVSPLTVTGNTTMLGTASRFLADFTNGTIISRYAFQTSTANSTTGIYAIPNGTSTAASWQATNNSDPTNASKILIATNASTDVQLVSGRNGSGTYLPLSFYTNGGQVMQLGTAGTLALGPTTNATTTVGILNSTYLQGGTAAYGQQNNGLVLSTVTSQAFSYASTVALEPAAFTLGSLYHFWASPATSTSSTLSVQAGFYASADLGVKGGGTVTTAYSFVGDIAAAANRWNLYMSGTANNYLAGSLGIGTTTLTGINLAVGANITGATTAYGQLNNGVVQSGVTTLAGAYVSNMSSAAASFTTATAIHFYAVPAAGGAGSTITSQIGFHAAPDLGTAGAATITNAYGFWGGLASGTNRWNLYTNGTANNFFAGYSFGLGGVQYSTTSTATNTATLTATQVASGFIVGTPTATASYTLPTAANLDTELSNSPTGTNFELVVFTTAAFAITLLTATGWTLVGSMATGATANSFARFRARKTGAGAWTLYRVS